MEKEFLRGSSSSSSSTNHNNNRNASSSSPHVVVVCSMCGQQFFPWRYACIAWNCILITHVAYPSKLAISRQSVPGEDQGRRSERAADWYCAAAAAREEFSEEREEALLEAEYVGVWENHD